MARRPKRTLVGRVALIERLRQLSNVALEPCNAVLVHTFDALHLASVELPRARGQAIESGELTTTHMLAAARASRDSACSHLWRRVRSRPPAHPLYAAPADVARRRPWQTSEPIPAGRNPSATALLVLADGTVLEGIGLGAIGQAVGEVCFNTAMTGYQEILTDPSYAGQIITFTFPHIGNVGVNDEDIETVNLAATPGARGVILQHRHHRAVELPRHAPPRPVAQGPRRDRALRHRHARADARSSASRACRTP